MNEFKNYHPFVNFIYFLFTIGEAVVFMNPLCLAMSLAFAVFDLIVLSKKAAIKIIFFMFPMILIAAGMNVLFNHEGLTILWYFPNGNPLTAESVYYGLAAAVMLCTVLCRFSCLNKVMTSDKIICLFGRALPVLSLIFSMTLRFVPSFAARIKEVAAAQRGIGRDPSKGSIIKRAKSALSILSIAVTASLEGAIITADSMKARGYGLPKRSAYSLFIFDKRDKAALILIFTVGIYSAVAGAAGGFYFRYFPSVKGSGASFLSVSAFAAYFLLLIFPTVIEAFEVIKWKYIKSKI